ncbi:MAG: phosphate/phosphite/phosphonate ABC transporter substrate-binding protein [Actinobacteria bacterium]|nr:phosphate/phosphite/phosphonate ABC transporter substrate-binding protein [Actinomycetota bacterium]MBW3648348.1 phosphate/phosphite/phosphonate ABC transporter substrate-binding protein [Actinomycetota bacterium]
MSLAAIAVLALTGCGSSGSSADTATERPTLRFAVGPFLPSPADTRSAYEPFFRTIAEKVGADYELEVSSDYAGLAVSLASGKTDLAWMGPFGYVLAADKGGAEAIATVEYDGKPVYKSIVVAPADTKVMDYPRDAKGLRMSFAETASTSGWLIPTYLLKQEGIDPKTYFDYSEGAAHPAQETAVANNKVDLATDFDRNRNAMIDAGTIKAEQSKIVWTSPDLPNDAIAVRKDLDPDLKKDLTAAVLAVEHDGKANGLLPKRYTGFVAAEPDTYSLIIDAARDLGKIGK